MRAGDAGRGIRPHGQGPVECRGERGSILDRNELTISSGQYLAGPVTVGSHHLKTGGKRLDGGHAERLGARRNSRYSGEAVHLGRRRDTPQEAYAVADAEIGRLLDETLPFGPVTANNETRIRGRQAGEGVDQHIGAFFPRQAANSTDDGWPCGDLFHRGGGKDRHGIVDALGLGRRCMPTIDESPYDTVGHTDEAVGQTSQKRHTVISGGGQASRLVFLEAVIREDERRPRQGQGLGKRQLDAVDRDRGGNHVKTVTAQQAGEPQHSSDMAFADFDRVHRRIDTVVGHLLVESKGHAVAARFEAVGQDCPDALGATTTGSAGVEKNIELPHFVSRAAATGMKVALARSPGQERNRGAPRNCSTVLAKTSGIGYRDGAFVDAPEFLLPALLLARRTAGSTVGLGIFLMFFGDFMFAVNDVMGKWLAESFSAGQIVLTRSFAALIVLAPLLLKGGAPEVVRLERPGLQMSRVALATAEIVFFYMAIRFLPLADVMTFYLAGPIYVAAVSPWLLGERVSGRQWLASAIGFAGVIFVLKPGSGSLSWASLISIGGSFCYAMMVVQSRQLRGTPDRVLVFWQTIGALAVGTVLVPFDWATPNLLDLILLAALGVISMTAHLCIARSLKLAPAAVVAPIQYSLLLWAIVFGWLVFGDRPQPSMLFGAAIIVVAGVLVVRGRGSSKAVMKASD